MITLSPIYRILPLIMMFLATTWLPTQKLFSQKNDSVIYPYYFQLNNLKSNNPIYSIIEGKPGEYFFATDNGVVRYDGQSSFYIENTTTHTNSGASLQKDSHNNIFFENFDGYVFQLKSDSLHLLNKNRSVFYLPYGIWKDELYIIQPRGLDVYSSETLEINDLIRFDIGAAEFTVQMQDRFYMLTEHEITAASKDTVFKKSLNEWKVNDRVKLIYSDGHHLYVCYRDNSSEKIVVFDRDLNFLYDVDLLERNFVQGIKFVCDQMWVLCKDGIDVYDKVKGKYEFSYSMFNGISITDVIADRKGVLWISTIGNGVLILPNLAHQYLKGFPAGINSMNKKGKQLYFGTSKGEIITGESPFTHLKTVYRNNGKSDIENILVDNNIEEIFVVENTGFKVLNQKKSSYEIALKAVTSIDEKYFAIATSTIVGLMVREGKEHLQSEWDSIYNRNDSYNYLSVLYSGVRSKSIEYDSVNKLIYVATNAGLYTFNKYGIRKEIFDNDSSIIAKKIALHNGNLIYNSYNGKLKILSGDSSQHLILSNRWVRSFKKEKDDLVIMLNDYFIKYNLNNKEFSYIPIRISNLEIIDYDLGTRNILLLTNKGMILARLGVMNDYNLPDFYVQRLVINDTMVTNEKNLELSHSENNITINFYINDIGTYIPYEIYYRVNEDSWKPLDISQQSLSFLKIQPGEYLIQFKMNDQILEESVQFYIKAPFWKSYWFFGLIFIIAISTIYFYYRWRIRVFGKQIKLMREKLDLEKQLGQSILTSVKAQMNPHFFFNALNTIQAYIMKNDKHQAITYLSKFSILTRRILNYSEKEDIVLVEEIDSLKLYLELELVRANNRFDFTIDASSIEGSIHQIHIPSMLIQPYVENAIKHGVLSSDERGKIDIRFAIHGKHLIVEVEDNGIGREAAMALRNKNTYDSFSMKANQRRLDVLNKVYKSSISLEVIDKKDEEGKALGTLVRLHIPLKIKDTEQNV